MIDEQDDRNDNDQGTVPGAKPYYDHDAVWRQRAAAGNPVWGGYSFKVYAGLLAQLQRHVPAPAAVLDVGCGAGAFGTVLAPAGYRYTGVDDSAVAIALGQRHYPELDLHCADFARRGVAGLPFAAGGGGSAQRFDAVTAVNVLHCLVDDGERAQFLFNLRQQAKDQAVLVLTTMCAPVLPTFRASPTPRCYATVEGLEHELSQAGWTDLLFSSWQPATAAAPVANWTAVARAGR